MLRIKDILKSDDIGKEFTIKGWIRTKRSSKSVSFMELNDGSSLSNLQIVIEPDCKGFSRFSDMSTGASVEVKGVLVESPAPKQPVELHAKELVLLGTSAPDYPLQKKRHTFEFLREIAHLRPRANTFGAVFRVRNVLADAVHRFFQSKGYIYLNAPIITTSDCEGAGEMFHVSSFDLDNPPRTEKGTIDWSKDFFGKKAALTVSGQLEAEIFACSMGSCYTFGPTFRAENSNTSRHLAEFWMVEPEIAFANLSDNMDITEEFIRFLVNAVLERCGEDLEFFDKRIAKGQIKKLESLKNSKFHRITYTDAIKELEKKPEIFEYKPVWGMDLQTEHERFLTEQVFNAPVFVTDYPKDIKAFYMRMNEDGKTVAAMDLLVPNVGEIVGGSQREERYDILINRINELGLDEKDYWWYLDLRKYGSIVHSGFGLGFERMVQYATGMGNIRDVIPFPRTPGNASF